MKFLVLVPLVAVASWWLVRALLGRPLPRADLRVAVGLLTGLYLSVTAALGLFWVSRMELPVFDWHYLVGYALLLAALWHVGLELPMVVAVLRRWFARGEGRPVPMGAPGPRKAVPWTVAALALGVGVAMLFWQLLSQRRDGGAAPLWQPVGAGQNWAPPGAEAVSPPQGQNALATAGGQGEVQEAMAYLLRDSAASAAGLVRRGLFFGPKVPSVRAVERERLKPLPAPAPAAGRTLAESLLWLENARRAHRAPPKEDLSRLLFAAGGITAERPFAGEAFSLRAAPSAGALYPVEIYFATTGLADLPAGVYAYVPQHHALQTVAERFTHQRWEEVRGIVGGEAVHAFLLTAVFQRTVWKYGPRSYRYVVLDAGHVAANLVLAAASLSWPLSLSPLFADAAVESLVAAKPGEEGAMAVASLGESPRTPQVYPPFAEGKVPGAWDDQELTRLSHALTRWQWRSGTPWVWAPRQGAADVAPGGGGEVLSLIASRRSYRRFAPTPLPQHTMEAVAALVQKALGFLPGGEGVEVHAVVVREEGLPSGVYEVGAETGQLTLRKAGEFGGQLYRAGLSQELLARAAAALVFTVSTEKLSGYGRRGVRLGLFAAGVAGEVAYLAAADRGLGACGVGAFVDQAMAELVGVGGSSWPVYLVALGRK